MPLTHTKRVVAERSGVVYALDPKLLLGAGGMGEVYRVHGGRVVKLLEDAPEVLRLRTLMFLAHRLEPFGVVCPEDLILDRKGGNVIGYLMRMVPGVTVNVATEKEDPPEHKRVQVALGVARAVKAIHTIRAPLIVHRDIKNKNT